MKKTWWNQNKWMALLSLSLVTVNAYAIPGTPDEDPVVAKLRSEFKSAKVPAVSDLKIGMTWDCHGYDSEKGNFGQYGDSSFYSFRRYDGLIRETMSGPVDTYATNSTGLEGEVDGLVMSLRVTAGGDLIGEWSRTPETFDGRYSNDDASVVPSIAHPANKVISYLVCPGDRAHK